MNVLSLFSGIGGLDLGLQTIGAHTRWYSENDSYASKIMKLRFPNATNLGDITQIQWHKTGNTCKATNLEGGDPTELGSIDIIAGGFP